MTNIDENEIVELAKEKGLAFTLDHLNYDGLGNLVVELERQHKALVAELVTLVRIGFLVRVNGERATHEVVRDPQTRKLLMTILQAENVEDACFSIQDLV